LSSRTRTLAWTPRTDGKGDTLARKFDRFMLDVEIGRSLKLAALTPQERWCHVAGVLAIAAKASERGFLIVGGRPAEVMHVAKQADVPTRVATSTLAKLRELGILVPDEATGWERIHDWEEFQVEPRAPDVNNARRQALHRDTALRDRIRTRDHGRCRYCGKEVHWHDRRGPLGGTYDHIDPTGPNADWNLVVACRGCNGRKCDRTLAEAGMALLPVLDPIQNGAKSNLDSSTPEVEVEVEGKRTEELRPGGAMSEDGFVERPPLPRLRGISGRGAA